MIDYHELLKTADELKEELAKQEQTSVETVVVKTAWLKTHETQVLIAQLTGAFDGVLDHILNTHIQMDEVEVKTKLSYLFHIRETLNLIKK